MKKINLTNIKNEKSVSEVLFDALKPKAITNEQSKTVYAFKLSVEREIEREKMVVTGLLETSSFYA